MTMTRPTGRVASGCIGKESTQVVFWHRELPPSGAEPMGEHAVEAARARVPSTLVHRDELWDRCYEDLMERAHIRLQQEIARLAAC
jgi:hypothetical protein